MTVTAGFTVTPTLVVPVQPFEFVTVTVYVVFVFGLTTTLCDEPAPFDQAYVKPAPPDGVAVNVVFACPLQMAVGAAAAVTVTAGLTVTPTLAVPVQPFELVTVTV